MVSKICYIVPCRFNSGFAVFAIRGEKNYGVIYQGPAQFVFEKSVKTDDVRNILKDLGYGSASIQQYGNPKEVIVRTKI